MSTNAFIAVQNTPTDFDVVYLHWGGYVEHAGMSLLNNYGKLDQARELVALGDLSSLGADLGECVAFHRDQNEDWDEVKPQKATSFAKVSAMAGSGYLYVWIPYEASEDSDGQRGPGMWSAFKGGESVRIEAKTT